jgi:hypothetical protein
MQQRLHYADISRVVAMKKSTVETQNSIEGGTLH